MQLMIELNDVPSGNVVIAASNAPQTLDAAIISRFAKRYLVDILDKENRILFFKQMLSGIVLLLYLAWTEVGDFFYRLHSWS